MSLINKRTLAPVFAAAVVVVWAACALCLRFVAERRSNTVELAFSWREAEAVCAANNYSLENFLDRLKAAGASSVILDEETPLSLDESGEAVFISKRDYSRLRLLDVLTAGSVVRADTLIFNEASQAVHYAGILAKRHSLSVETRTFGSRRFVYIKNPGIRALDGLPLGPSAAKMRVAARYDFRPVPSVAPSGDISFLFDPPHEKTSALIFENAAGIRPEPLPAAALAARFAVVDFEFHTAAPPAFFGAASVVRGHRIFQAEKVRALPDGEVARYERAARERGVRFFKITLDDTRAVDANLDIIKTLSRRLKKTSYTLGPASSPAAVSFGGISSGIFTAPLSAARKALAFCLALFFPAVLARFARNYSSGRPPVASFALFNAAVIIAALFTAAFVSSSGFLAGMEKPFGIRFLLVFSWVAVLPALFDPGEVRDFFGVNVKVYHLAAAAVAVAAVAAVLWRSGNESFAPAAELRLRDALERIFTVRPRWKEILVGQPFLWLAFRRRNRLFLFAGSLAAVSVINTFLHSHTPLAVSLWRTLAGVLAGGAAGVSLDALLSLLNIKIPSDLTPSAEK